MRGLTRSPALPALVLAVLAAGCAPAAPVKERAVKPPTYSWEAEVYRQPYSPYSPYSPFFGPWFFMRPWPHSYFWGPGFHRPAKGYWPPHRPPHRRR